jgi:hypothetical protein
MDNDADRVYLRGLVFPALKHALQDSKNQGVQTKILRLVGHLFLLLTVHQHLAQPCAMLSADLRTFGLLSLVIGLASRPNI